MTIEANRFKGIAYWMSTDDDLVEHMLRDKGMISAATIEGADVVVFTGGADVNPEIYGHPRHPTTSYSSERDRADLATLLLTDYNQIKVGICRGAQLLNVTVGNGYLFQDVNKHALHGRHKAIEYTPSGVPTGKVWEVTSTHHQMMIPSVGGQVRVGAPGLSNYRATGTKTYRDTDNLDAEVVLYVDHLTMCFQPHPEYIQPDGYTGCTDLFFSLLSEMLDHQRRYIEMELAEAVELELQEWD